MSYCDINNEGEKSNMALTNARLSDADYRALSDIRFALRKFLAFSEEMAAAQGLTPQQHQALLSIRGMPDGSATVGHVAERLLLKPHSASGLVGRLESLGLVTRLWSAEDRRQTVLRLTRKAETCLAGLSATHRHELQRLRPELQRLLSQL